MNRILALVDQSIYADSVVDHAAWLGGASGRGIDVAHIIDPIDPSAVHVGMAGLAVGGPGIVSEANLSDEKVEELRAKAQVLVDRVTSRIAGGSSGGVTGHVIVGEPRRTVAELQKHADAIVLGKRGQSADFVNLTLGSTLQNVIGVARVPLVVAPRVFRPIKGWVLAAGDDFGMSRPLNSLLMQSFLPTMPCEIVHVGEERELLLNHLSALSGVVSAHDHPVKTSIFQGQPVRTLAEQLASDETRLLAIGKFGRARLLPWLFGDTVASDLTKATLGPILVLAP